MSQAQHFLERVMSSSQHLGRERPSLILSTANWVSRESDDIQVGQQLSTRMCLQGHQSPMAAFCPAHPSVSDGAASNLDRVFIPNRITGTCISRTVISIRSP
jgi:hypothetical protein